MGFYPKSLTALEYDKIREMLASYAQTDGARQRARELDVSGSIDEVVRRQRLTTDAKRLIDAKGMPSFGAISDMDRICERAQKGAALSPSELLSVGNVLKTSRGLREYCYGNHVIDTSLDEVFERLVPNRTLEDRIYRSIISEESIADDASPALASIRRQIRATNSRIKDVLQRYIQGGTHSRYLQENIVTTRNGRYVIPVKAECKNEVKGLIHDTSSSGATIFVEPSQVVEANNELRVLQSKEQHEIERVLFELSGLVADYSERIMLNYFNITELAFYFACGRMSIAMNAISPTVSDDTVIELRAARHPLIDKDKVVPINIRLGGEFDTMIITGPNTGGKTVTLKTLGLFVLMAQAGLHIPCDEGSSICVLDDILVDIGDEQSIEQSLSTFSSHMVNIVAFLPRVGARTLVLFDELGVGTDPIEGAALAVSVIDHVRGAGAMCAATTHYAELKAYALDTVGVVNASCEFDVDTLRPTYRLIIGTPGKSNAFAISEKLGLPQSIIESAQSHISSQNRKFEDVIGQLEQSRLLMDKYREEALGAKNDYEKFKSEAEKQIRERLSLSARELEAAQQKASAIVASAKASSDYILAEMDKLRKKRESEDLGDEIARTRRAVREHIRENEDKFDPVRETREESDMVCPQTVRKGDKVFVMTLGKDADALSDMDRSGNVQVRAGVLTTRVNIKNLRIRSGAGVSQAPAVQKKSNSGYTVQRESAFRDEIDLRGMTGDEAWLAVDKYFDEASLAGISRVRLIHGKGTGALKKALWEFLRADKRVASFRIGQWGEGDGGVTVVDLK